MKVRPFTIAGLLIAAGSIATYAQQGPEPGRPAPTQGEGDRPSQEALISQFDTDGDGTLSESERQAMREAMPGRRGGPGGERPSREEIMKRYDTDGDGQLNDEERAAMQAERQKRREARRQEMLERFDADGDGQLSEEERNTMRETLRAERPQPTPAGVEAQGSPEAQNNPEAAENPESAE